MEMPLGLSGQLFARFRACRHGGVFVYAAFVVPVLLGFAGLSVDVGTWYVHKRSVQSAADTAAVAGAVEIMRSGDPALIQMAAQAIAAKNGFDAGSGGTLTVNHPPTSGPSAGSSDAVEVVVRR